MAAQNRRSAVSTKLQLMTTPTVGYFCSLAMVLASVQPVTACLPTLSSPFGADGFLSRCCQSYNYHPPAPAPVLPAYQAPPQFQPAVPALGISLPSMLQGYSNPNYPQNIFNYQQQLPPPPPPQQQVDPYPTFPSWSGSGSGSTAAHSDPGAFVQGTESAESEETTQQSSTKHFVDEDADPGEPITREDIDLAAEQKQQPPDYLQPFHHNTSSSHSSSSGSSWSSVYEAAQAPSHAPAAPGSSPWHLQPGLLPPVPIPVSVLPQGGLFRGPQPTVYNSYPQPQQQHYYRAQQRQFQPPLKGNPFGFLQPPSIPAQWHQLPQQANHVLDQNIITPSPPPNPFLSPVRPLEPPALQVSAAAHSNEVHSKGSSSEEESSHCHGAPDSLQALVNCMDISKEHPTDRQGLHPTSSINCTWTGDSEGECPLHSPSDDPIPFQLASFRVMKNLRTRTNDTYSGEEDAWLKAFTQLTHRTSVETGRHPEGSFFAALEMDGKDPRRSATLQMEVACQEGNGQLEFDYWSTYGDVLLKVCTRLPQERRCTSQIVYSNEEPHVEVEVVDPFSHHDTSFSDPSYTSPNSNSTTDTVTRGSFILEIIASGFFQPSALIIDSLRYTAKSCEPPPHNTTTLHTSSTKGKAHKESSADASRKRERLLRKLARIGGTPIKLYGVDQGQIPVPFRVEEGGWAVEKSRGSRYTPEFKAFLDQLEPYLSPPWQAESKSFGGAEEVPPHSSAAKKEIRLSRPPSYKAFHPKQHNDGSESNKVVVRQLSACELLDCDFNDGGLCHYEQVPSGNGGGWKLATSRLMTANLPKKRSEGPVSARRYRQRLLQQRENGVIYVGEDNRMPMRYPEGSLNITSLSREEADNKTSSPSVLESAAFTLESDGEILFDSYHSPPETGVELNLCLNSPTTNCTAVHSDDDLDSPTTPLFWRRSTRISLPATTKRLYFVVEQRSNRHQWLAIDNIRLVKGAICVGSGAANVL